MTDAGIEIYENVVIISPKGEAVALGLATMTSVEMMSCTHGLVAKLKRVIMERDTYSRQWGLGPTATKKKMMKASGQLDVSRFRSPRRLVRYMLMEF